MPRVGVYRPVVNGPLMYQDMVAAGLNQQELARRARCSEMQVSRAMRGLTVDERVYARIAKALGQTADRYLLGVVMREKRARA